MPESSCASETTTQGPIRRLKPPFDFYGMAPSFYLNEDLKMKSWGGFICSIILFLALLGIAVFYFLIFIRRQDMRISNSLDSLEVYPFIDLRERKSLFVLRPNYPSDKPFFSQRNKFYSLVAHYSVITPEIVFPGT
jgi:hypothetical protein